MNHIVYHFETVNTVIKHLICREQLHDEKQEVCRVFSRSFQCLVFYSQARNTHMECHFETGSIAIKRLICREQMHRKKWSVFPTNFGTQSRIEYLRISFRRSINHFCTSDVQREKIHDIISLRFFTPVACDIRRSARATIRKMTSTTSSSLLPQHDTNMDEWMKKAEALRNGSRLNETLAQDKALLERTTIDRSAEEKEEERIRRAVNRKVNYYKHTTFHMACL